MGFCQLLIIKDGVAMPIEAKMQNSKTVYRALCEKDGKLCIVESKKVVTYESFVTFLKAFKVTHALYLDMGSGWNYAWYRDKDGQVIERFPESKLLCCDFCFSFFERHTVFTSMALLQSDLYKIVIWFFIVKANVRCFFHVIKLI